MLVLFCFATSTLFAQTQRFGGVWHNRNDSVVLRVTAIDTDIAGTVALSDTDKSQVPMPLLEPKIVGQELTFTTTSKGRTTFWSFRINEGKKAWTLTGHVGEIELVFKMNRKDGSKTE